MARPANEGHLVPEITSTVLKKAFNNPPAPGRSYYVQERGGRNSISGCMVRVLRTEVWFGTRAGGTWHKVAPARSDMTPAEIAEARQAVRHRVIALEEAQEPRRKAMLLRELQEAYLQDWRAKRGDNRSPRTEEGYRDLWERYLLPFELPNGKVLGDMPIDQITPKIAQTVKLEIPKAVLARKPTARRGGQTVANRALQQAAAAFSFACRMQEVLSNPFGEKIVVRYHEESDGYSLQADELRRIGEALAHFEELAARPRAPLAVRSIVGVWLLLLTGARPAELTEAYIDRRFLPAGLKAPITMLDDQYPRIWVQRAKGDRKGQRRAPGRFIWLAQRAVRLIHKVPRVPGDAFLLPGDMPGDHLQRLNSAWRAVLAKAGVQQVPLKSTRHTFRTWAAEAGISPEHVQQLLGHAGLRVTDTVYLHGIAPALIASADRAAEFIQARLSGENWIPGAAWEPRVETPNGGVVTPFRRPG